MNMHSLDRAAWADDGGPARRSGLCYEENSCAKAGYGLVPAKWPTCRETVPPDAAAVSLAAAIRVAGLNHVTGRSRPVAV